MNLQSIDKDALLVLHRECIAEHGGDPEKYHSGNLEAALAYPMERAILGDADIAALAAAYAFGVLKLRPFAEGNTRVAFLVLGLFLYLNGWRLAASQADAANVMLGVAAGDMDEERLAEWVRSRL